MGMPSLKAAAFLITVLCVVQFRVELLDYALYIEDIYFPEGQEYEESVKWMSDNLVWSNKGHQIIGIDGALLNCQRLNKTKLIKIGSGWSKDVFAMENLAVKMPNEHGESFYNCLRRHFGSVNSTQICRMTFVQSFVNEIRMLNNLQGDENIPKFFGYCLPEKPEQSLEGMRILVERASPVDVVYLVQLEFQQRVKIVLDVIKFLKRHRTLDFRDLRRQQFVHVNGRLLYIDFDDVTERAGGDYDDVHTASRIFKSFVSDLLSIGAPQKHTQTFWHLENLHANNALTLRLLENFVRGLLS